MLDSLVDSSENAVELISNFIFSNLNSNSILKDEDTTNITDNMSIISIISKIKALVYQDDVNVNTIIEIINKEIPYYSKKENEKKLSLQEKKLMKGNIKTLLVPNKDNRYSPMELEYLNILRKEFREGRAVPIDLDGGHVLTALDIKYHNDKWFVLIRDPFNIERVEYYEKDNGEVEKKFTGMTDVISEHTGIRKISPNMKDGFMGISWWELKDVTKMFSEMTIQK